MAIWTVTSVCVNATDTKLFPTLPTSVAVWYGSVENSPQPVAAKATNGEAGKFRATSGTATGTTAMSVYACPDPAKAIVFLIMMPYGTGEVNETKTAFIDAKTSIDKEEVKRIWNDAAYSTAAQHRYTAGSKEVTLLVSSKIDQGTNVQATFTVEYKP